MASILGRQTIIFFLPLEVDALATNYNNYAASSGSGATERETVAWHKRQMYINPTAFNIADTKLVQKQLTKGGHMVQYWGEDLATITMNGTTGSSGIEGINILRDIYRHEQLHYRKVLADRHRAQAAAAKKAAQEAEEQIYSEDGWGVTLGTFDALTGGGASQLINGVSNGIDILIGQDEEYQIGSNYGGSGNSFQSVATLASFATNIDMYYQGEFFRGYFTNFSTSESGTEPGLFTYNMTFTVTRRSGKRKNFMPWHRNPLSADGEPVMAQLSSTSKGSFPGVETLSFPTSDETWNGDPTDYLTKLYEEEASNQSTFASQPVVTAEENEVPIDRHALISGD